MLTLAQAIEHANRYLGMENPIFTFATVSDFGPFQNIHRPTRQHFKEHL